MTNPAVQFVKFFDSRSTTGHSVSALTPYLFNATYDIQQSNEASLYDSINTEFTYHHGSDVIWIEREVNNPEPIFGEYLYKKIEKGTPMRLFIEEVDAWGGGGDMYTKFGLQVTDECTLYCPKRTFLQARPDVPTSGALYPKYNDLVYIVKSKKLFEVTHIEDAVQPTFYVFGNLAGYKISCKLYVYDHSEIDKSDNNGIPESIEQLDKIFTESDGDNWNIDTEILSTENNAENNLPIDQYEISGTVDSIVDNSEIDPLTSI